MVKTSSALKLGDVLMTSKITSTSTHAFSSSSCSLHSDPFEVTFRYGRALSRRRAETSLRRAAKVACTVVCSILGTIFGFQAVPSKITFTWNETLGWSLGGILFGEGSMLNAPIRLRNKPRFIGSRGNSLLGDSSGCVVFKV